MVSKTVRVRAYASIANLGPGFDILAMTIALFYDEVEITVHKSTRTKIDVEEIAGPYSGGVPANSRS